MCVCLYVYVCVCVWWEELFEGCRKRKKRDEERIFFGVQYIHCAFVVTISLSRVLQIRVVIDSFLFILRV